MKTNKRRNVKLQRFKLLNGPVFFRTFGIINSKRFLFKRIKFKNVLFIRYVNGLL